MRKEGKSTLRGANQAGEDRALMICPLRTPVFTGAQDRVVPPFISGAGVSRRFLPLISAAAPLVIVGLRRALGTRLLSVGICTRRSTVGRTGGCLNRHQRQRKAALHVS